MIVGVAHFDRVMTMQVAQVHVAGELVIAEFEGVGAVVVSDTSEGGEVESGLANIVQALPTPLIRPWNLQRVDPVVAQRNIKRRLREGEKASPATVGVNHQVGAEHMAETQPGILSAAADIAWLAAVSCGTAGAGVAASARRVTQDLWIDECVGRDAVFTVDLRVFAGNVGDLRVRRVAVVCDGRRCLIVVEHHLAQQGRVWCGDRLRDGEKILHHDPASERDSRTGNGIDVASRLAILSRE